MKILFAASEAAPLIKSGGLGDVAFALPRALAAAGHEVRVVIPLYGQIKFRSEFNGELHYVSNCTTPLGWRNQYTGLFRYGSEDSNPAVYLIDNEYYFCRTGRSAYGDDDDGERFTYFSRAVLETIRSWDFVPDVIHCNDWQTAAIPVFKRAFYPDLSGTKTLFTIHNIEYQGKAAPDFVEEVMGLPESFRETVWWDGCTNLMKGAILESDAVNTVSRSYAQEILTDSFGMGLDPILRDCRNKLSGVVNGIDMELFNPRTDRYLFMPYTAKKPAGKSKDKLFLQEAMGLKIGADIPLIAMISRLAPHKGFDILGPVIDRICDECDAELTILGNGDPAIEAMVKNATYRHPGRIASRVVFDVGFASQMYAGADLFLMPSRSEPCGLSQMVAMRYGCIPIVRETGGLRDTVPPYNPETGEGRGITFVDYTPEELLRAVLRGVDLYRNQREQFLLVQKRNMNTDFSWNTSVKEYEEIYRRLTER